MKSPIQDRILNVKSGIANIYTGQRQRFIVNGNSMDDGTSKSIVNGDIALSKFLNKSLYRQRLKIEDFPYWVIYYERDNYPIIKQIIEHNTDEGYITVHSLNNNPEYSDFKILISEIHALFYVTHVIKKLSKNDM